MRQQRADAERKAAEQGAAEREAERRSQEAKAQRDLEARALYEQARAAASADLRKAISQGLTASLTSFLCPLLPMGSLVGLYYFRRARRLSRELGEKLPMRVWLSLPLSGLGLGLAGLMWIVGLSAVAEQNARQDELRARLLNSRTQSPLSREVACDLLELHLLEKDKRYGYHYGSSTFFCGSAVVEQRGQAAILRGASIVTSMKKGEVFTCLAHVSSSWRVLQVRDDAGCTASPVSVGAAQP